MTRREKREINRELAALASLMDSDIDTSDIPEITNWSQAAVDRLHPSQKTESTRPPSSDTALTPRLLSPIVHAQLSTGTGVAEMANQQLVLQCVHGEAEAWSEFVRRYQMTIAMAVIRTAGRWGNTAPELIDDLIQDTYLKLAANNWAALREFDGRHEDAIYGYLKVVAANIANDYFRAQQGEKRGGDEERVNTRALESINAAAQPEMDVFLEEIDQILKRRDSDRDRAIFWLYYRHGFSAKAIAAIHGFGLTVKGVESLLTRLTRTLKRELSQISPTPRQRSLGRKTNRPK